MKVSLNTIKFMNRRYGCGDSLERYNLPDLLEQIGGQLGAIEEIVELGKRYDGVVVVKVTECIKHPNADKLHVCKVDDGKTTKSVARDSKGLVQVVCGAPNVKSGMLAAWIPPGVTVPSTVDKDPFVLEARDIRGQMSNGMLASLSELGISDDHTGILEVEQSIKPGTPFADAYELKDDVVIDIENKMFTHRPDCFGFLGVARELSGIQHKQFKSPAWYKADIDLPGIESEALKLEIHNEIPKLVPRFMAVVMREVQVRPSPMWLQVELSKVGLRPINNIVDYTNFFMLETGQPLHAYDYDKVKSMSGAVPTLQVRQSKPKEKLSLLSGKTVEFDEAAILIATDKVAIGVGGVMGGAETEVDENTKNIILECANFDMYSIRRTSMKYGLFTDAVTRFNKGQSPFQTRPALAKIVDEIRKFANGKVASKFFDSHARLDTYPAVTVSAEFVNARLGTKLSLKEMAKLLENVEFKIMSVPADKTRLHVIPPFWRTDIEIPEDVVEEVGRLYGYDHLPLVLPSRDLTPAKPNEILAFKANLRQLLASAGCNELLTYSFVHSNLFKSVGQDSKNAYELSNALSPDLQYYRMSVLPSLLDKVHANIKAGYREFGIFEMNKVHNKDLVDSEGLPIEEQRLGFVFAADNKIAQASYKGAPYYQAKLYLQLILDELGITAVFEPATTHEPKLAVGKQAIAPFEKSRAAYVKTQEGELIGEIGEFKTSVRNNLKLPDFIAGFELDIERLMQFAKPRDYTALSRFPKVEQDISLRVAADISYADLYELVSIKTIELAPENSQNAYTAIDIYQPEDEKTHQHVTLRLNITPYERTLTATEVNKLLDEVALAAHEKFKAERI